MPNLDDTRTLRTHALHDGIRIFLDANYYDDAGILPPDSPAWLHVDRRGDIQLGGADGRFTDPIISFASHKGRGQAGGFCPLASLLAALRGELQPETRAEYHARWEARVLEAIEAGQKPSDVGDGGMGRRTGARKRKARKDAVYLWNCMWRRALPHTDQEALRLVRRVGGGATLYRALVQNERLYDLARVAPGIVELLDWSSRVKGAFEELVPEITAPRVTLTEAAAKVISVIGEKLPRWDDGKFGDLPVTAGFLVWLERAQLSPRSHPFSGGGPRLNVIRALLRMGTDLDPNRMRQISHPDQWYLLHYLAGYYPEMLPSFFRSPAAAVRAVQAEAEGRQGRRRISRYNSVFYRVADTFRAIEQDLHDTGSKQVLSIPRMLREEERYHRALRERRAREVEEQNRRALLTEEERDEEDRLRAADDPAFAAKLEEQRKRALTRFPEPVFTEACSENFHMRWIGDGATLDREGAIMGHCVASYIWRAANGESIIYHVEQTGAKRVPATLELNRRGRIMQLYGVANQSAPPEMREWVAAKVQELAPKGPFGDVDTQPAPTPVVVQPEPQETWEEREARLQRQRRAKLEQVLLPEPAFRIADDGTYRLRAFATEADLEDEITYMGNTVTTYTKPFLAGKHVAFRLERIADGFPLGTIACDPTGRISQSSGIRDRTIEPEILEQVQKLVSRAAPLGLLEHGRVEIANRELALVSAADDPWANLYDEIYEGQPNVTRDPFDTADDLPF